VLIGRQAEVDLACAYVGDGASVLIGGRAGVGKSTLLDACIERLAAEGFGVIRVVGVAGAHRFPLAALAHLSSSAPDVSEVVAAMTRHAGSGTVVAIDDAQHLDDLSLQAVASARATGRVRVLATARTTGDVPDAVAAIGRAPGMRVELQPLSRDETAALVRSLLGGEAAEATVERIVRATDGLPLHITELIRSGLAIGALEQRQGLWHWRSSIGADPHLEHLLGLHVDALGDTQQAALETLCLAEHLPYDTVERIHPGVDLVRMEASRVIRPSTRQGWLVPGHPLLRDAALGRMTATARRAAAQRLHHHWREHRPVDVELRRRAVMLACEFEWDVDLDAVVEWALWSRSTSSGTAMAAVTERAWRDRPSVPTALAHSDALVQQAEFATADAVLRSAADLVASDAERVSVAISHCNVLRHGLGDLEGAAAVMDAARSATESAAEQLNLDAVEANDRVLLGEFGDAIALWRGAMRSLRHESTDDAIYRMAQPAVIALATGGHVQEAADAHRIVHELRETSGPRHSLVATTSDVWWSASSTLAGAGERSIELIRTSWETSVEADNAWLRPVWALPYAMNRWLAADLVAAERLAREAMGVMPGLDEVRALAGYALVRVLLLRGCVDEAATLVGDLTRTNSASFQAHASWLLAAQVQVQVATGSKSIDSAIEELLANAEHTVTLGQVVPAAYLLHDAMRLDSGLDVADRLDRLSQGSDAPVVFAIAGHAGARRAGDAGALIVDAQHADSIGLRVIALAMLDDAVRLASGGAARARASALLDAVLAQCTGVPERAVASADPLGLSRREREVARAAAQGLTDREIAEQLVVSVRTVNAQLRSVYAKLGIDGRRALRTVPDL
jgi:DNA-binding NarL/FixJ family response regulator